jgi:hypothetical protein
VGFSRAVKGRSFIATDTTDSALGKSRARAQCVQIPPGVCDDGTQNRPLFNDTKELR